MKQKKLWQSFLSGQAIVLKTLESIAPEQGRSRMKDPKERVEWGRGGEAHRPHTCEHQLDLAAPKGTPSSSSLWIWEPSLLSCTAEMLQQMCAKQDQTEGNQGRFKKWRGKGEKRKEWKFDYRVFIKSWYIIQCLWKLFLFVWWQKPNWRHVKYVNIIYNLKDLKL